MTIAARSTYQVEELRTLLADYVPQVIEQKPTVNKTAVIEEPLQKKQPAIDQKPKVVAPKTCPKCQSVLQPKVAKKGKQVGKAFLACSSYPQCRSVTALK